jgi:hypothetical protein
VPRAIAGGSLEDMGPRQLFLTHQDEQDSSSRWESSRSKIRTTTTRYSVYPLPLDRPPAGMTVTRIQCGKCGQEMRWKVYSAQLGRRRRRWAIACGAALLPCVIAALLAPGTLTILNAPTWARIVGVTLAVMSSGIFAAGMMLLAGPDNMGVRLRGGGTTHSVRDNSATVVTTEDTVREPPRR